ncbi:MAG TPA: ATP-binding protein [Phenylobacterium sp.]
MSTGAEPRAIAPEPALANARALEADLAWLNRVLLARLGRHFAQPGEHPDPRSLAPPDLAKDSSDLGQVVRQHGFGWTERLVLLLALVPHVRPELLDPLFMRNANIDRGFTEFGGVKGKAHSGFLPTGETAAFLAAGDDLAVRAGVRSLFDESHPFATANLLRLEHDAAGEPFFSGTLVLTPEALARLTTGETHKPDFSSAFPAKLVTSRLEWGDLVLGDDVLGEIDTLLGWIRHHRLILDDWGLSRVLQPGYRSLFFGPPGTGKTLTATLIGREVGADVYRIDLSQMVSKYIGETEKNLARVFDQGAHRNWILFFDEADALFGKRTATSSSHDRYANQEVSYLLQRVEDFPGIVILATNLKGNIDDAFVRRFQTIVHFPMPDAEQRLKLWRGTLRAETPLAADVDLERLAARYELSGGAISTVVRFAAIRTVHEGRKAIRTADLAQGVVRELRKEGRTT